MRCDGSAWLDPPLADELLPSTEMQGMFMNRTVPFSSSHPLASPLAHCLSLTTICALVLFVGATPAQAQFGAAQLGSDQVDLESSFFLPIPRESRLRLDRIRLAAEQERWTDAAQDLITLLSGEKSEDFLVPLEENEQTTSSSVKSAALNLVRKLPPKVLEAYDLLVGSEPEALFKEALTENDPRKLAEVSRRFLFTPSGEMAAIILARKAMDARQWEGALLELKRLDFKPPGSRKYLNESDLLRAVCLFEVGQETDAKAIIARLMDDQRLGKLLPNLKVTGSTTPEKILEQLAQQGSADELPPYAWTMFQGSTSRTAPSRGSEPLQEIQWNARMAQSRQQQDEIDSSMRRFRDNRIPVFPAIHPVIVADQVVFRTPAGLLATDIQSGKVLWKFPWDNIDLDLPVEDENVLSAIFPGFGRDFERALWADARSGHLSSDGKRLFYVHQEQPAGDNLGSLLANVPMRSNGGLFTPQSNQLYCFDISREGAVLWRVGGVATETGPGDNQLSEARFLGPPLPLGKDLMVLAGIIDEVRLLCIDAETGKINWSQQLARQTASNSEELIANFMQAASPSHKGGILVCPTNAGSIVAVDLSNRTLLWGFQYKEPSRDLSRARIQRRDQGTDFMSMADRWSDGTPLIHHGKVIVTPTDSDYIYCVDLLTGEKIWERPRRDNVALASVFDDIALVIGKTDVTAYDIETGDPVWETPELILPDQAMPTGYGFRLGDRYYLPTTQNQILPIDVKEGKLGVPIEAVGELGNLVCYKDYVISVSPKFVTAFKQIDALRREVAARLEKNPMDAQALRMQGKLQKHDGDLAGALVSLQKSYDIDSTEDTRIQLVSTGLAALSQDFAMFQDTADSMQKLVQTLDEKIALARLTARGLHVAGKYDEALERYFAFLDLTDEYLNSQVVPNELLIHDFDPLLEVSAERWARGRISRLFNEMNDQQREDAEAAVSARLDKLLAVNAENPEQLAGFVNRFPRFAAAQEARVRLAEVLFKQGDILQGETVLRSILTSKAAPERVGPLVYQLADALKKAGLQDEAAQWFKRISSEYSSVAVDGKRTGRQVAALQQWDEVASDIVRDKTIWPYSAVDVEVKKRQNQGISRVDYPIRLSEQNGLPRADYSLLLDSEANLVIIRDKFGKPIVRIPFTTQSERKLYQPQIGALHAQQFGHLLIFSLGNELQAFNMLPNVAGEDSARLVWDADLQNGMGGSHRSTREFEAKTSTLNPLGEMDRIARDVTTGKPIGQFVGNHDLICYQIGKELVCRNPISGDILWEREGVELGCQLVVTDEYVIAIPEDEDHERGEVGQMADALVLSADNGEIVDTVELPSSDRIWTVRDGVVVAWQKNPPDDAQGIEGFDAATGKLLWSHVYKKDQAAKGVLLKRQPWVVMLDSAGMLQVIDIPSGNIVQEKALARSGEVIQLKAIESEDQFLVAVYRDIDPRPHFRSIPYDNNERLLRGEVYALESETGKMLWDTPALIHDNYLLEDFQSSGLPVIALVARLHRPNARTPQDNSALEALIVDKRDGRVLFRREFREWSATFSLSGDPNKKTLQLELAELEIDLKFDPDQPNIPAPPADTELDFSYPPQAEDPPEKADDEPQP